MRQSDSHSLRKKGSDKTFQSIQDHFKITLYPYSLRGSNEFSPNIGNAFSATFEVKVTLISLSNLIYQCLTLLAGFLLIYYYRAPREMWEIAYFQHKLFLSVY